VSVTPLLAICCNERRTCNARSRLCATLRSLLRTEARRSTPSTREYLVAAADRKPGAYSPSTTLTAAVRVAPRLPRAPHCSVLPSAREYPDYRGHLTARGFRAVGAGAGRRAQLERCGQSTTYSRARGTRGLLEGYCRGTPGADCKGLGADGVLTCACVGGAGRGCSWALGRCRRRAGCGRAEGSAQGPRVRA
jgi:hypothetical protein